jgi:hypothetical protein
VENKIGAVQEKKLKVVFLPKNEAADKPSLSPSSWTDAITEVPPKVRYLPCIHWLILYSHNL